MSGGSAPAHPSPWSIVNDYNKTVVSVAAAFLAFTGTFSTDERLAAGPLWPLFLSWFFLIVAIAAALFSEGRLTSVLNGKSAMERQCQLAANVSYFALFAAVLAFFGFATTAARSPKPDSGKAATSRLGNPPPVLSMFKVEVVFPPFVTASATEPQAALLDAVCRARQALKASASSAAVVVGRFDRRDLRSSARALFGSNIGLAQQRADTVRELLASQQHCDRGADAIIAVLSVVNGPTQTDVDAVGEPVNESAVSDDRRVTVYGLRILQQSHDGPVITGVTQK